MLLHRKKHGVSYSDVNMAVSKFKIGISAYMHSHLKARQLVWIRTYYGTQLDVLPF